MEAATEDVRPPVSGRGSAIAEYFRFAERGTTFATEIRAGLTTFMVMAYIIFVNPNILKAAGMDPVATAAATALVAGIMTIAMGVFANYPLALAAGLSINSIVAFTLVLGKGLTWQGAMGVIFWEGVIITVLVVIGLREAIMSAVPLSLKRAIGVGIGLFILFIGFVDAGLIVSPGTAGAPPVQFVFPTQPGPFVAIAGLLLTIALSVLRVRGALLIAIVATTVLALVLGVSSVPSQLTSPFNFGNFFQLDPFQAFTRLGVAVAVLTIFAIMLSDFFDTMGTVTGIAAEAGLARPDGSVPGINRVLIVDSVAAAVGGIAGTSSNTTYIESAAGVAEGGRTGFASVVTGLLFLVAIVLAPIAGIVPPQATAPALIIVGFLMFTLIRDIPVAEIDEGLPALLTMILMPLTFDITIGIGAGFISWVLIRILRGRAREVHPLMWIVSAAFVIYFLQKAIEPLLQRI